MDGQRPSCDYLTKYKLIEVIIITVPPLSLCVPPAYQFLCIIATIPFWH